MPAMPTVRRRILGRELRALREAQGLTSEETATRMGWDPAKMTRLEQGRSGLRLPELGTLLDLYQVTDPATREALGTVAREAKRRVWWTPYNDVLTARYTNFIAFETEADSARNYESSLVPGLLQLPDYARAVTRALRPKAPAEEINALVDVRLGRQNAALARETPLKLWAIVDEGALRRMVAGPSVMARQLRRLTEASEEPNITLQVLPFSAGGHAGLLGSFVILGFPLRGDLDVVYVESHTSSLYLEREDDLVHYTDMFNRLRATALDAEPSRNLISDIAKELT